MEGTLLDVDAVCKELKEEAAKKLEELSKTLDPEYKQLIEEEALGKGKGFDIPNSTLEHAILVQTNLIKSTKRTLLILTGDSSEINHPQIRDSIENLAKKLRNQEQVSYKPKNRLLKFFNKPKIQEEIHTEKGIKVIMYDNETAFNRDFYNFLRDYVDIIKVRMYKPKEGFSHFLVSDSKRCRLEEKHSDKDIANHKISAIANFNNPEKSSYLEGFFNRLWNFGKK